MEVPILPTYASAAPILVESHSSSPTPLPCKISLPPRKYSRGAPNCTQTSTTSFSNPTGKENKGYC